MIRLLRPSLYLRLIIELLQFIFSFVYDGIFFRIGKIAATLRLALQLMNQVEQYFLLVTV